jgi:hypothetical protein
MTIKLSTTALALLLLAGIIRAQEAKPAPTAKESVMTFFKHLKESLAQSAVQGERKHNRAGSVAAVRGADQSSSLADPNEPVLKGDSRSKKNKVAMAEDAEFAKAVDLVIAGKIDDGVKALEAFKIQHPKSRNLAKLQQAIDQAKGLLALRPAEAVPAAAPVAAVAPAVAPSVSVKTEAPKPEAPAAEPAKK